MKKILKLLGFSLLFAIADCILLRYVEVPSSPEDGLIFALLILGASVSVMFWFSGLMQMWPVMLILLSLLFLLHVVLVEPLTAPYGPLSITALCGIALVFSLPIFLLAAILNNRLSISACYIRQIDRTIRLPLAVLLVVLADVTLLAYFNTLIWPHFWPTLAFAVLAIGFALLIWFPELGYSIWMLRSVGFLLVFVGQSYLLHSLQTAVEYPSVLTIAHLLGFVGTFVTLWLNYVNQIRPKDSREAPLPDDLPAVAVVVPTYGEPYEILNRTIASLTRLDYPKELLSIVVSDDSRRPEIANLAQHYQVHYNPGPQKDAKAGNLNSALQFLEQIDAQATLLMTQDADEVIDPSFLKKTIGYFTDSSVAFVQTPKEAVVPTNDPFGTRDRMFYDILQVGRNGYGAAFACGSGVIWRIEALRSIGGFAAWNVVEDLTTSYYLHSAGYRSEYHNEILSVGLAPDDIPGLLKQRGTWAVDTWRLFLFDNPLFKPGLTLFQRLQYLELGLFYVMSAFFTPLLMFIPVISLATGTFIPIKGWAIFPWLLISSLYYLVLARGRSLDMLRMWQYWIGHWPTYLKAFWIAVRSRNIKPKYVVTRKTRNSGFYAHLLWAQFAYLLISMAAIIHALFWMADVPLSTRLANIGVALFFMYMISPICRAAFYGIHSPFPRWVSRISSRS